MAVTDHLAAFAFLLGIIFSFSHSFEDKIKKSAFIFTILGIIAGFVLFSVRLYDPKGMNIFLIALNRKLSVTIAGTCIISIFLEIN